MLIFQFRKFDTSYGYKKHEQEGRLAEGCMGNCVIFAPFQ